MKKTLLLTLAAGLISTSPLMALDLYITGSTAFRANVHDACFKLFDSAPTEITGTAVTGGDSKTGNAAAQWVMTGTVSNKVSAVGTTPLTIHALFTGSVQGIQTVEQNTKLTFITISNGVAVITNNTPTIAFSDASSESTPYPASGTANYNEEQVAVQPFVMVKSVGAGGLNNITNVTWEQLKYAITAGRIPLSSWTYNTNDHNSFVYMIQRTKDSGTRRTEFAQELDGYNQGTTVYIYDPTNTLFYKTNTVVANTVGSQLLGVGVVGAAGNANANLNWGSGYVGGGDIKTELGYTSISNQAISYLSMSDAKGVTGVNWSQVIPFNGIWPTTANGGISGNSTLTNDYSPITKGLYTCWGYEVVVYPTVDPSGINNDQNLTATLLGSQTTPGTILGVLDNVSTGTPLPGSIDNEIEISKNPTASTGPATAIRIQDMVSSRSSVGGTITP
jgi:hypothetical protein